MLRRKRKTLLQILLDYTCNFLRVAPEDKEHTFSPPVSNKSGYTLLPDGDLNDYDVQYFDVFDGHNSK